MGFKLIKKDIQVLLLSIAVTIVIISALTFFIVWLCFPSNIPKESFKDALDFTGSLFGGLATFGAAIIAAYLVNDWREQHNKDIENQFIKNIIDSFNILDYRAAQIDIKFSNFKTLYSSDIYSTNDHLFESFEEKYLDPLIVDIGDLRLELAKLNNYYQLYSSFYDHNIGNFESVIKDMQNILYLSSLPRCGFGDKFDYLDKVFLPSIKDNIWLLEDDYIRELIPKLKALT